jgi:virginiamycin A acetyltransferase
VYATELVDTMNPAEVLDRKAAQIGGQSINMPGFGRLAAEAGLWQRRKAGNDIRLFTGVEIDDSTVLEAPVRIGQNTMVYGSKIGSYSYVGANSVIQKTSLGRFCSGAWGISLGASSHPLNRATTHTFPWRSADGGFVEDRDLPVEISHIGHDVWIGCNAVVLSGVTIGNSAVIAAGAVVTRDVLPYTVVMGAPARAVRLRYDEALMIRLDALRWWDWPPDVLGKHVGLFQVPLSGDVVDELEQIAPS